MIVRALKTPRSFAPAKLRDEAKAYILRANTRYDRYLPLHGPRGLVKKVGDSEGQVSNIPLEINVIVIAKIPDRVLAG